MTIGARIKTEREKLGMTQTTFGAVGDVGKTTVIAWERGTAFPNAAFLAAIANAGADIQYIVTGQPTQSAISPEELLLLSRFRESPKPLQDAALRVLLLGDEQPSAPKKAKTHQVFHGKVGDVTNVEAKKRLTIKKKVKQQ